MDRKIYNGSRDPNHTPFKGDLTSMLGLDLAYPYVQNLTTWLQRFQRYGRYLPKCKWFT